jgi:hypothetical protein
VGEELEKEEQLKDADSGNAVNKIGQDLAKQPCKIFPYEE